MSSGVDKGHRNKNTGVSSGNRAGVSSDNRAGVSSAVDTGNKNKNGGVSIVRQPCWRVRWQRVKILMVKVWRVIRITLMVKEWSMTVRRVMMMTKAMMMMSKVTTD